MLKVYLSSVIVWFLIAMAEGLLFREQFRKSRDMVREHFKNVDNKKYYKVTLEDLINLSIKVVKLMKREL